MTAPDPWRNHDFTPPPRDPAPERPPGSRHLKARWQGDLERQADALELELITDINFNQVDFEYSAWAAPVGGES